MEWLGRPIHFQLNPQFYPTLDGSWADLNQDTSAGYLLQDIGSRVWARVCLLFLVSTKPASLACLAPNFSTTLALDFRPLQHTKSGHSNFSSPLFHFLPQPALGIPLVEENVRVTITVPKLNRALLPIPTNEATSIEEVVGGFVAWPKSLVIVQTSLSQISKGPSRASDREAEGSKRTKKIAGRKKIQSQPEVEQQPAQQELPSFDFNDISFELRPLAYYAQSSMRDVIDPWDDSVMYFNLLGNEPGDDFKDLITTTVSVGTQSMYALPIATSTSPPLTKSGIKSWHSLLAFGMGFGSDCAASFSFIVQLALKLLC
ncbi:hypothetical protein TIFTF001_032928 [Ficus carica]|uniref:Uncharacterized protein n=1 Tax=Ficus carica TaxID=3494 RepID=A0AA88DY31_FICCA|nr:hypothetical protein TIFTF001_032928 [Ficus carica]